jgi:hypothetical protein
LNHAAIIFVKVGFSLSFFFDDRQAVQGEHLEEVPLLAHRCHYDHHLFGGDLT